METRKSGEKGERSIFIEVEIYFFPVTKRGRQKVSE